MKLFAKKSLGQHFLNSKHVLEQIITAAQIKKGEYVLEIGPGTGVLTRALLTAGAQVIAIEKDQRAIGMLEQDFFAEIQEGRLKLILGDILDPQILNSTILNSKSVPSSTVSFSLVANIPYYITGAILEQFLEHGPRPDRMVLLVQKEVAERIVARDGKESILSVSVKAFGTPRLVATVPPGAFTPPPTVDSAILSITNISDRLFGQKGVGVSGDVERDSSNIRKFFSIVKAGFAHKRKYALRNVEAVLSPEIAAAAWKKAGLDPKIRAEDITLEQWAILTQNILAE